MKHVRLFVCLPVSLLTAGLCMADLPSATSKAAVGWTSLQAELGGAMPTGAGIHVMHVEAPTNQGGYFPNPAAGNFAGKTINDITGDGIHSDHSDIVGVWYYGLDGYAPGITDIDVYELNHWLQTGSLNTLIDAPPQVSTRRVQNHSWAGNILDDPPAIPDGEAVSIEVLRRMDMQIDRDDVLVVVGMRNESNLPMEHLAANLYNAIAATRSVGAGQGPTTLEGVGRVKPDIAAPASATSFSTPSIASLGVLLIEAAGTDVEAAHSQTVKALLMAGATKEEYDLDGKTGITTDDWSRTATQPLDLRYGSGEANIHHSYKILTAGQQEASDVSDVGLIGWDYDTIAASGANRYFFEVPAGMAMPSLSVIATWNRHIQYASVDGEPVFTPDPLTNIDLALHHASDYTLGSLLDESISTIDNVEHLYQRGLTSGRYAIELTSDLEEDFALAWDGRAYYLGDANRDGVVNALDLSVLAGNWMDGNYLGWNGGDFNLDGTVNALDLSALAGNWMAGSAGGGVSFNEALASVGLGGIPEPSSLALVALGAVTLMRRRR